MKVETGLDRLVSDGFKGLLDQKVGLVAHPASVDVSLRHILPLMHQAGVKLTKLYGPEHGVFGDAQDMEVVEEAQDAVDALTGAQVYSLYGHEETSLRPSVDMLSDLDVIVVDLQDVGARYYTFAATMVYVMQTAAEIGLRVMVLDRPNPLGGRAEDIEGPPVDEGYRSFVGAFDLPMRHGLTMGEYAHLMKKELKLDVDLEVIEMNGWKRGMDFDSTGLPWVLPSPNMPTVDSAWIYPGMCIIEGTQMSEGRGTTRPFELIGAPYIDPRAWVEKLSQHKLPGIALRPTYFTPTFQKHGGTRCGGLQIHVTDRPAVRSVHLAVAFLETVIALAPEGFKWRTERYEYITDRLAIDLLFGSTGPKEALESGAKAEDIVAGFAKNEKAFALRRADALLYHQDD
jgi:uncharacterized protein YbbC (DUF1343 family)